VYTSIGITPLCGKLKHRKNAAFFNVEKLRDLLVKCTDRGFTAPPLRWLAKRVGVSIRSIQRYLKILKSMKRLAVIYRKISAAMNRHNLYKILDLQKPVVQKQKKLLKTNTTTRENPRAAYESRQSQDKRDRERMQLWYAATRRQWDELKRWRFSKANERIKNANRALVGYCGHPTEYDPVAADAFWKRQAARKLAPLERLRLGLSL
jgi:hypothetical protein